MSGDNGVFCERPQWLVLIGRNLGWNLILAFELLHRLTLGCVISPIVRLPEEHYSDQARSNESKTEIINALKAKYNLTTRIQFVIDIDINPESSTPFFGLNKKAIDFLAKTGTEVYFDLYKADTVGLLEK
jgi:hypothetical protein